MKKIVLAGFAISLLLGCSNHNQNDSHIHGELDVTHGEDARDTETITLFSENLEVFAEFESLQIGHKSKFLIHVTRLDSGYVAYTGAAFNVVLTVRDFEQAKTANPTDTDGIYELDIEPQKRGIGRLSFDIPINAKNEQLIDNHIHIYDEGEEIHVHGPDATGLVMFTKEQAWNSKFEVIEASTGNFTRVILASGEFLAMPGEKQNVIAKSQGIVLFATKNLVQGKYVEKGEELFTLSGQGLANNNILVHFNKAKTNFQKSKDSYTRHKVLMKENIISQKQYLETESEYINDSLIYYSLKETVGTKGMKILAPLGGYLHELNVSEGQYVEPGDLMATISTNKVMLLRADLPQHYFEELEDITSTHFRPAYSSRVYTLEELSGKLIARGASVAENNHYMPVYFEVVNDGTLLEGAFAEFFLKTDPEPGHIVIPVKSLIEEQGNYYIYMQVNGEMYQKQPVTLNASDGIMVSIASGIAAGDHIVNEGAMLLKTSASASIPSHNHQH